VELKNNVKRAWWKNVVQMRDDVVGLDASIFMHPLVWKASGHADKFADLVSECKKCNTRTRVDHLEDANTKGRRARRARRSTVEARSTT
jgi:glycyl-tRNA synthetase